MIESIFISDLSRKLLVGAHQSLSESGFINNNNILNAISIDLDLNADSEKNTSEYNTISNDNYPITFLPSSRIAHLKVNDILINILYQGIDNFQAAKFLLDLKSYIEDKIITLNATSIQKHYFLLLELLQTPVINFKSNSIGEQNKDTTYIDIVQNIHFLSEGENVIVNKMHGEVFVDTNCIGPLDIQIEKKRPMKAKSVHMIEETESQLKIRCENIESQSLFSFYHRNLNVRYFKMVRSRDFVTLESEYKGLFKHIEIIVPVGILTYKVEMRASNGKCDFDIKKGLVYWRFRDCIFKKETIKFSISALEMQTNNLPVTINFRIEDSECCSFKLTNVINREYPTQQFWVRNTTQSGIYELYD